MKLLLDTHAFLWFISGDSRLSTHARELIEDASNERFLSVVSIWEMVIKSSIGKLVIPTPIEELVKEHVVGNDIQVLPIETPHFDALYSLPFHHKDPFDRMMIAQAICENMSILSTDGNFPHYPVQIDW
jgi:PIN domain nuclease of toxin-antitoxin system